MSKKAARPHLKPELIEEIANKSLEHLSFEAVMLAGFMLESGEITKNKILETVTNQTNAFKKMIIYTLGQEFVQELIQKTIKGLRGKEKNEAIQNIAKIVAVQIKRIFIENTTGEKIEGDPVLLSVTYDLEENEEFYISKKLPSKIRKLRQ